MKYKVGDKILVEAEVIEIDHSDEEFPINVVYENGSESWVLPELIHGATKFVKTYEQGLQDAWELAKKIADWSHLKRNEILGTKGSNNGVADIFKNFTPQEALAKLKEYEEEKSEIKMGDVVISSRNNYTTTGVFYGETKLEYWILTPSCKAPQGLSKIWKLTKTGKHVDISGLLEQIRQ